MSATGSETSTTPSEFHRIKIEIKKQSETLADLILKNMRSLTVLGIVQPTPPRPKPDPELEIVGRLLYATMLIQEAMTKLDRVIDA